MNDKPVKPRIVYAINYLCTKSDFGALDNRIVPRANRDKDDKLIKEMKSIFKNDTSAFEIGVNTIFAKLKANDSETRLCAFRLIDIIFRRMHRFRLAIVDDYLNDLLNFACGLKRLPKPEKYANALQKEARETIKAWEETFVLAYPRLKMAVSHLELYPIKIAQPKPTLNDEQKQAALDKIMKKVYTQIDELIEESNQCVQEMITSCEIIFPITFDLTKQNDALSNEICKSELEQSHALTDGESVTIKLNTKPSSDILPAVRQSMQDSLKISNRLLLRLTTLLRGVQKLDQPAQIKRLLDAKNRIIAWQSRITGLGIHPLQYINEFSDDDDFEDIIDDDCVLPLVEDQQPCCSKSLDRQTNKVGENSKRSKPDIVSNSIKLKNCCNAPLKNGHKCPRMDAEKCPFHGPIGRYTGEETYQETESRGSKSDLQHDVERQLGFHLTTKKSGNTRHERRKQPERQALENRLHKKLYNRSTRKRVAQALDSEQAK